MPKPAQAYEPEVPVEVREWISSALASPDLVLEAQPPAQPHSRVVVERPIRRIDGGSIQPFFTGLSLPVNGGGCLA